MARKKNEKKKAGGFGMEIHPHSAGVDLGAEELVVAVGQEKSQDNVKTYQTHTPALFDLRDWLLELKIETVAMESTGNYWIAPYQILEDAGIKVFLVNARHVKAVPGKKTDVNDAQWLQYLNQVGLLKSSFRPSNEIASLRYLMRHRASLVEENSRHLLHMQKVLTEMNLKLHHVFSDLDGQSAMAIIEAILEGERDADQLWELRNPRCKSTKEEFKNAIVGDWREEYLFVLEQCLGSWKQGQKKVKECDEKIEELVKKVDPKDPPKSNCPPSRKKKSTGKNDLSFPIRDEAWKWYGVDLTAIDGLGSGFLSVLMSEVGTGLDLLENFKSPHAFASWLGLCPTNKITGGKVFKSRTRKGANRLAQAFRMAAFSLNHNKSEIGNYTRKMKGRLGKAEGITAVAHKLARVVYTLIKIREPYDEKKLFMPDEKTVQRRAKHLQAQAEKLGLKLVPAG